MSHRSQLQFIAPPAIADRTEAPRYAFACAAISTARLDIAKYCLILSAASPSAIIGLILLAAGSAMLLIAHAWPRRLSSALRMRRQLIRRRFVLTRELLNAGLGDELRRPYPGDQRRQAVEYYLSQLGSADVLLLLRVYQLISDARLRLLLRFTGLRALPASARPSSSNSCLLIAASAGIMR